jgi:hypothetical protein
MPRHHGIGAILALVAVFGFAAGDCRAESITMVISWNGNTFTAMGTAGPFVGPGSGPAGAQQVLNINVGALNSNLAALGSAYSFSNLGVITNFPGTTTSTGGFLQTSGALDVATTGTAGPIVVTGSESGFTAPTSSPPTMLFTGATANYTGTTSTSTQSSTGSFMDSGSLAAMAGPVPLPSNGTVTDSHNGSASTGPLPAYVTPYTLTNQMTLNLTPRGASQGSDGFSGQTSVVTVGVPEPTSVVVCLTGMPVLLVIVGLRRRRRGVVVAG